MERTFVMVKPDGVQRRLMGEILARFERAGLKVVAMKFMKVPRELAEKHYEIHRGKPFYEGLIAYITSGPVLAMVIEGINAIERVRAMVGATDPQKAAPGTIRGDFCQHIGRNAVHASDGPETAATEIALWFTPDEIADYSLSDDGWIYE
ncbi:MAG: nucleoside-diphosphate kinase [Thermoplasmata archaeon]|nr:MAG: nucleoside-diphosphate kinase [Thermoplasmata archaeon]